MSLFFVTYLCNYSVIRILGIGLFTTGTSFQTKTASVVKIPGTTSTTSASSTNIVTFNTIRNPNKIKTTDSLTIKVFTSSNALIAQVSSGVTLAASALTSGSSNVSTVTPTSNVVQTTNVGYHFVFNPGKFCILIKA